MADDPSNLEAILAASPAPPALPLRSRKCPAPQRQLPVGIISSDRTIFNVKPIEQTSPIGRRIIATGEASSSTAA
jgi:hypothetical protein